jgi:hypothetical protein
MIFSTAQNNSEKVFNNSYNLFKVKYIHLFILCHFLAGGLTHAQLPIQGMITDSAGNGIMNAIIIEKNTNNYTYTNYHGNFTIQPLTEGSGTLQVFHNSYNPVEREIEPYKFYYKITVSELSQVDLSTALPADSLQQEKKPVTVFTSIDIDVPEMDFSMYEALLGSDNVEFMYGAQPMFIYKIGSIRNRFVSNMMLGYSFSTDLTKNNLDYKFNGFLAGWSVGYNIIDSRRFVVKPYSSIKWYRYRLQNSEKGRTVDLEDYIANRELDMRFNHLTGSLGLEAQLKINIRNHLSGDYMTMGGYAGYLVPFNKYTWLFSAENRLIYPSGHITFSNLNWGITFNFVFY